MSENNINIFLRLNDKATAGLKMAQAGLLKFSESAEKVARELKRLGRDVREVGQAMTIAGAAVTGPMILAFKNAEKYSFAVGQQITKLKNVTDQFQISIATAMVPVVQRFTNILAGLLNMWNRLSPGMQQAVVQTTLLVGVFLTLGGVAVMLIGKLMILGSALLQIGAAIVSWVALNPIIAGVVLAVGFLIAMMIKYKDVSDVVLGAVEALWQAFLTGLWTIIAGIAKALDVITFGKIKALGDITEASLKKMTANAEKFNKVMAGDGSWAKGFEDAKNQAKALADELKGLGQVAVDVSKPVQSFVDGFKQGLQDTLDSLGDWGEAVKRLVLDVATSMKNTLSDVFFDAFTGELKSAQEYFRAFGRSILRAFSDMLAQMMVKNLLGALMGSGGGSGGGWGGAIGGIMSLFGGGSGGGTMHNGGIIRAHSGLAVDEVPIIAQRGEGVLSRQGMAALGGSSQLNRLNRGEGSNGVTVNPVVVIQAWDAQDVYRNRKTIEAILVDGLRTNSGFRNAIKQYA